MGEFPEHEKMAKVKSQSQSIGQFLDWLHQEKHIQFHRYEDVCYECGRILPPFPDDPDAEGDFYCLDFADTDCDGERRSRELVPDYTSTEKLLAEFFGIDLEKVEQEKQGMLAMIRETSQ